MGAVTIVLCYLCFIELIIYKFSKKHKKALSVLLAVSAAVTMLCLFIWGVLRNF